MLNPMKLKNLLIRVAVCGSTLTPALSLADELKLVSKPIEYALAGKSYQGHVAYLDGEFKSKSMRAGVLVAHNWLGITQETVSVVERLAREGYIAFAVDIYGKNDRPSDTDEAARISAGFKKDRIPLRNRMRQGLSVLKKQPYVDPKQLIAIGYCFGGTAVLELARSGAEVKGVVSFHGGLDSPKPADGKRIKARVLALHGADDPYVPNDDLVAFENEMKAAQVDWQLIKYGGAVHSFTEKAAGTDPSKGAAYNERADRRSWVDLQQFLKEVISP